VNELSRRTMRHDVPGICRIDRLSGVIRTG
jgi:hypothetical protein